VQLSTVFFGESGFGRFLMQHKKTLGERMKEYYEFRSQTHLTRRMPVVMRLDGRAFHSLSKKMGFEKPFDGRLQRWMLATGIRLCEEIQGAKRVACVLFSAFCCSDSSGRT